MSHRPPLRRGARPRRGRLSGFGPLLVEVSRLWRHRLDERLRPLGLSQAKWVALYRLARLPAPPTQSELAAELGIEGPTVVRLLDRLEAGGYVVRRPAAGDRRVKVVHLTARARHEAARIDRIAQRLRRELLGGLVPGELATARHVLLELREQLGTAAAPPATGPRPRDDRR